MDAEPNAAIVQTVAAILGILDKWLSDSAQWPALCQALDEAIREYHKRLIRETIQEFRAEILTKVLCNDN